MPTPTNKPLREEVAGRRQVKHIVLNEDIEFQLKGSPLKVDRQAHCIYDVKLLGWHSKNRGRRYSPNGINPELYEGAVVNIDHPDAEEAGKGPRPLSARFGEVTGIYKRDDGLYAKKFEYNPKHPLCESILWMAEHKPHLFGCSQNAFGDVYEDAQGEIVETVTDVRSIDLVSEPATTKGLYEGTTPPKKKKLEEDDAPPFKKKGMEDEDDGPPPDDEPEDIPLGPGGTEEPPAEPGVGDELGNNPEDDDDAAGADDMPAIAQDDTDDSGGMFGGDGGGSGINIDDEMMSMMSKILSSDLDPKAKKKKLSHLIDTHCHLMQEGVMSKIAKKLKTVADAKRFLTESKDPAVSKAGRAVVTLLDRHETKERVTKQKTLAEGLCLRAKLPPAAVTPHFISTLIRCTTEREMMEAIEDRRQLCGIAKSNKPRSTPNGMELSEGVADTSAMTADERKTHEKKLEDDFLRDAFKETKRAD